MHCSVHPLHHFRGLTPPPQATKGPGCCGSIGPAQAAWPPKLSGGRKAPTSGLACQRARCFCSQGRKSPKDPTARGILPVRAAIHRSALACIALGSCSTSQMGSVTQGADQWHGRVHGQASRLRGWVGGGRIGNLHCPAPPPTAPAAQAHLPISSKCLVMTLIEEVLE